MNPSTIIKQRCHVPSLKNQGNYMNPSTITKQRCHVPPLKNQGS